MVAEIKAAGGEAVADYNDVVRGEAVVETALKAFGKVDILINNAGILRDGSFQKMSKAQWESVLAVHLRGAYSVTRAAWNHMREARYGRVIFVSSAAGLYGNFGQANYSAAKLAVVGLTNVLALEGGRRNIHVNCVAPIAASRMTETVLPAELLASLKPEFAAPAVAFLAHESCEENGGVFELGAGWVAKLRWERSKGAFSRLPTGAAAASSTASPPALSMTPAQACDVWSKYSPETVSESWKAITDFAEADHPESNQEVFGLIMQHMSEPDAPPVPAGPGFASDAVFEALAAGAAGAEQETVLQVGAIIRFSVTDGPDGGTAHWLAQFKNAPAAVEYEGEQAGSTKAALTVCVPDSVMVQLGAGTLNAQQAFMRGKLKLKGNMALAMKLGKVLDTARAAQQAKL